MGYYQGSGVMTSKTADGQFLEKIVTPVEYIKDQVWIYLVDWYTQKSYVTVNTKNGVQEPSSLEPEITYYNNGMVKTKKAYQASRIGDSNLFTLTETITQNDVYCNGVKING